MVHKQDAITSQLTALSLCSASFARNAEAGTFHTAPSWLPTACLVTAGMPYFFYLLHSGLTELLSDICSRLVPCVLSDKGKAGSSFMWWSWGQLSFCSHPALLTQSSSWWMRKSRAELLAEGTCSSIPLTVMVWLQYLAHPFFRTFRPCGSWM